MLARSKIVSRLVCKKKVRDNTIKENVTVTSSNFSQNNGTIRILTHFLVKNQSKLTIEDKI